MRKQRKPASQLQLWVDTHPLRGREAGYTCYARICGEINRIRILAQDPQRGTINIARWPLSGNRRMFVTDTEYSSIEILPDDWRPERHS